MGTMKTRTCLPLMMAGMMLMMMGGCAWGQSTPLTSNADCHYEPLPENLDGLMGLGFNGELHIHETFFTNYTHSGSATQVWFTVSQASNFRIYVGPHPVDIDIMLYNSNNQLVPGAITVDWTHADEVVQATLNPGRYYIQFVFYFSGMSFADFLCPTMTVELSIIPTSRLTSRIQSYRCPPSQNLPALDLSTITDGWSYDSSLNSTVDLNTQYNPGPQRYIFLQSYPFTLPDIGTTDDGWEVVAQLGMHFPTASLGLLLIANGSSNPTNLDCYETGQCYLAEHTLRGQNVLKALLRPGAYVLWLYDVPSERNNTLLTCTPFTFSLTFKNAPQEESFLTCRGIPFPTTLNVPGLMDHTGYIYYLEEVLVDLSLRLYNVSFNVSEPSYFRGYSAHHRVDFDLKLFQEGNNNPLAYALQAGGDEGIQYVLQPGNYFFQVIIYGSSYISVHCDSLMLEIAIAPQSLYSNNDVCTNQGAVAPDLSGLTTLATTGGSFALNSSNVYRYLYNGDWSETMIITQQFTLPSDSFIKVTLGSNFLTGDIRFYVRNGSSYNYGYHRRNVHYMDTLFAAGSYTFVVVTGATQNVVPGGFPACSAYSFAIEITPYYGGVLECLASRSFPSTFNTPQNLMTSPKIHFAENFLIPSFPPSVTMQRQTIEWTVSTQSYFRMYVEPHHVDIDVHLLENGTYISWGTSFNGEEAIAAVLKPGYLYRLNITYYLFSWVIHPDEPCSTFDAELAITPITEFRNVSCDAANNLPTFPANAGNVTIDDDFYFTQTRTETRIRIPFTVTSTSVFRAFITYNFLWNDLALSLQVAGTTTAGVTDPSLHYNKNELESTQLPPGNYTLTIYEPFAPTDGNFALHVCVKFHLTLALETINLAVVDPLRLSCPDSYFPPNWNNPGFISPLSNWAVDFNRYVLVDVSDRRDSFKFNLTQQSMFRLFIPIHIAIDVDVTVRGPITTIYRTAGGSTEENIQTILPAGAYTVDFTYYGYGGIVFPAAGACVSFPISINIAPYSSIVNIPPFSAQCASNFTPTIDFGSQQGPLQRNLSIPNFRYQTSFTVRTTVQFIFMFQQSDITSALEITLQARNVSRTYYPLYFLNHVYLNEYLPSGTYTLNINDPTNTNHTGFQCGTYNYWYLLLTASIPPTSCPADPLPTDLFTWSGGSGQFGGPQADDGSIHLLGDNFAMMRGIQNRHNYISFNVSQNPSYLRMFFFMNDEDNLIVANLYMNQSVLNGPPMFTLIADRWGRSDVWILPARTESYVLDVYYQSESSAVDCNYYTFEFVLEPQSAILNALSCPNVLPTDPMPAPRVSLVDGQDYQEYDDYVITSEAYREGFSNGVYTYAMTISVATPSLISAMVGYDFLINEFGLILQDYQRNNLTMGYHGASEETDSFVNFENRLDWYVPNGYYYLLLTDVGNKIWQYTTFCHFFEFSLLVTPAGQDPSTNPRILQVTPANGRDLNAAAIIYMTIHFSTPATVMLPPNYDLLSYVQDYKLVYLSGNGTTISPFEFYWDTNQGSAILRFGPPFAEGATYQLVINNTAFYTQAGNKTFAPDSMADSHNYSMYKCDCGKHGQCLWSRSWFCRCLDNFGGPGCASCNPGYHYVQSSDACVINEVCNDTFCNGHGTCSASTGVAVCSCDGGYAGATCALCGPGYVGYPNCSLNRTDIEAEGENCPALILPTELNGPEYLGFSGSMHLQGWFFINLPAQRHDMVFSLKNNSLFRVFTEPHAVDVDVWLYRVASDGTLTAIAWRLRWSMEEVIYMNLPAANYMLRFQYYEWVDVTDCETFNMELSIAPYDNVVAEANSLQYYCGAADQLPPIPALNLNSNYSYRGSGFTINAPANTNVNAYYPFALNITIAPPANTPNVVASLHATVGYRFMQGQVALILEAGADGHCKNLIYSLGGPPVGCTFGDSVQNENSLHRFLQPGVYTLYIYEPIRQLPDVSKCAPFDFGLTVEFVDEDTLDYCDLPEIPVALDYSEYMEKPGYAHFRDVFLLSLRTMAFKVTEDSFMRVAVDGNNRRVQLYNADTHAPVTANVNGNNKNILAYLSQGNYYLSFASDTVFQFCPVLELEFALEPVYTVPPISIQCTTDKNPSFQILTLPFVFAPTYDNQVEPDFYTSATPTTPVVSTYPFQVFAPAFLDARIESNLLPADLRLEVWSGTRFVAAGSHRYNYNQLLVQLPAGSYELRIVVPPTTAVTGMPKCAKYNFNLLLSYAPPCNGDRLPFTFNTMRFLGYEGWMDYQSSKWIVPGFSNALLHQINFTAPVDSLIRVYTEPFDVDVDVWLVDGTGNMLTTGSSAVNMEESLVYQLTANTAYALQLRFFQPPTIPYCPTFNMEVAIGPVPPRQLSCPDSAETWPNDIGNVYLPYVYDSVDMGDSLYYRQQDGSTISHEIPITTTQAANFRFEVGYDFLIGDLKLKLYSENTDEWFFGVNSIDRNVINLDNMPPGDYDLYIYEAAPNPSGLQACNYFTFAAYIEKYSSLISDEQYLVEFHLPSSLDSIAFTNATGSTHISNTYWMFDGTQRHETTSFTPQDYTLLRVETMMVADEVAAGVMHVPIVFLIGHTSTPVAGNGSMLILLNPGRTYTLRWTPPVTFNMSEWDLGYLVSIQISINTMPQVQNALALLPQPPTCQATTFSAIQTSSAGDYHLSVPLATVPYSLLSTTKELARIPFSIDRYSLVYVRVGAQFLLNEMDLRIFNSQTLIHGRISKNLNTIHQLLPAGDYNITISQFQTWGYVDTSRYQWDHCGFFSVGISIVDVSSTHATCPLLHQLPTDLNLAGGEGSSAPYGGPINTNGILHMYVPYARVPELTTSQLSFYVNKASLVSVIATDFPDSLEAVDYRMIRTSSATVAPTSISSTSYRSREAMWDLTAYRYNLYLQYRTVPAPTSCNSFTLQVDIAPKDWMLNQLMCEFAIALPIPSDLGTVDNGVSGTVDSLIQGWNVVSGFSRDITFTTTKSNEQINFIFAYNSLVNRFTMTLKSRANGRVTPIMNGQLRATPPQSSKTTAYQHISTVVPAGDYTISINHPTLTIPFNGTNPETLCLPFVFTYNIGSVGVGISEVDPPSLSYLSADQYLRLTVTFNWYIYGPDKAPVTSSNGSVIMLAFYLSGDDGATTNPVSAQAYTANALIWVITFAPIHKSSVTNTLSMRPNILFDRLNNSLSIPAIYKYSTFTCVNGQYDSNIDACYCNMGYAGPSCAACDSGAGYTPAADNSKICVYNKCTPSSCGLNGQEPLGQCFTNSTGQVTCKCQSNYDGPKCEVCAAGYRNYPTCSSKSSGAGSGGDAGMTFLKVLVALVAFGVVGVAALWVWRQRLAGQRYKLLDRFGSAVDEEDGMSRFPDMHNQLMDDRDELRDDSPDAVELPRDDGSVNAAPQYEAFSSSNNKLIDL